MDDRELLEAAAKAAGMSGTAVDYDDRLVFLEDGKPASIEWNPLTDDGDALRLAVKLNITVFIYDDETSTALNGVVAKNWGSKEANTRRAIVRAAAAIRARSEL